MVASTVPALMRERMEQLIGPKRVWRPSTLMVLPSSSHFLGVARAMNTSLPRSSTSMRSVMSTARPAMTAKSCPDRYQV